MPILAYCIVEANPTLTLPASGVRGIAVQTLSHGGMQCLFSKFEPDDLVGQALIREAALEFNRVLQDLLRQGAVVPFRFPTILSDENELAAFLAQHAAEYESALRRLRDTVQMEVRLDWRTPPAAHGEQQSGAEYLRGRRAQHRQMQRAAAQLRAAVGACIRDWRLRESGNGVRCYALIARDELNRFLSQVKGVVVPPEYVARVTGPWPATEFLKED